MKVLLRKLKTALSFSTLQWKTFLTAYFLLLQAQWRVLVSSQKIVEKTLFEKSAGKSPKGALSKKELFDLFRLAWRYQIIKPNCLPTSLALQAFLSRYGFAGQIRIGVRKEDEKLKAHAWLETGSEDILSDLYDPLDVLEKESNSEHA